MPGMDGFETARKIKESRLNKETPIIFVTAVFHADPFIKKGFDVGAIDYFGKPFDPDILKAKVGIYTELYLKTKRLQETEQLLKSHGQIKTLLEAIPIGIIIANGDGQIYEYNEEAVKIWGGIRETFVEDYGDYKGWWEDSGKSIGAREWAMARALEKGEISEGERIVIEAFDGKRKTISNSAFPIRGDSGAILGAVAVVQDISARAELAEDIHRALQILQEARALTDKTQ